MSQIRTEFLFTITLEFDIHILGDTPYGIRRIGRLITGSFEGPKLKGSVSPGGGSWVILRRDDVLEIEVRITLETTTSSTSMRTGRDFAMAQGRSLIASIAARMSTRPRIISAPRRTSRPARRSMTG
jgi:Protein of unknown function (DUF3237)